MSERSGQGPMSQTRRWAGLGVAVLLIPVGLGLRLLPGLVGDLAGGVAYAAMIYALLVAIALRLGRSGTTLLALVLTLGIELLQLTGLPAAMVEAFGPARYLLGSTFAWLDLVSAAAGVAVASGVDALLTRSRRARG
ncbi:DUF2809 domain-containing protein [Salana multivorans]